MISSELQLQVFKKLCENTEVDDWEISGPKIQARECIIYKASSRINLHNIAIKVYRRTARKTFKLQYEILEYYTIKSRKEDSDYLVPRVFGQFPDKNTFLMEWIDSPALERRLWRYFYSKKHVQSDIRRTFVWLKKFHQSANLKVTTVDIDSYKHTLSPLKKSDRHSF